MNLLAELLGDSLGTSLDTLVDGLLGGVSDFALHAALELLVHTSLELLVVLVGGVALGEDAVDARLNAGGVGLVAVALGLAGGDSGVDHGGVLSVAHFGGDLLDGVLFDGGVDHAVDSFLLVLMTAGDAHGGDENGAADKR